MTAPAKDKKIHILLSNDDGCRAPGLLALKRALESVARVTVVAPDREQSGASHAITLFRPLRVQHLDESYYCVDGTPTDCVYVALSHLLKDDLPDLVFSGINAGPNLGSDVTYSGTVAAAMEAAVFGLPSVAISLAGTRDFDYTAAARFAALLAPQVSDGLIPNHALLNVNVPPDMKADNLAWRSTVLGHKEYARVSELRVDPRGNDYLWIGGPYLGADDIPGSDCNAINDGIISVTPISLDMTATQLLPAIDRLSLPGVRASTQGGGHPSPPGEGRVTEHSPESNAPIPMTTGGTGNGQPDKTVDIGDLTHSSETKSE